MPADNPQVEEVDLTPDDDATLEEIEQDTEERPREIEEENQKEFSDIEELARQQAVLYRDNAEGISKLERINNAIEAAQKDARRFIQEHAQYANEHDQTLKRIDRLEQTRTRVEEQPHDIPVLQTMAGGISLEVPTRDPESDHVAYDRTDLAEEIDETIDALEGHVEDTAERAQVAQAEYEKTELALKILNHLSEQLETTSELANEVSW